MNASLSAIVARMRQERAEENLAALKRDIAKARAWARKHWAEALYVDEETTPSTLLDPARLALDFPDVDRMTVCPVSYGRRIWTGQVQYRLCWRHGLLVWEGDFTLRRALLNKQGESTFIVGRAEGHPGR